MNQELVMPKDSLEDIMDRLRGGLALLNALYEIAGQTAISEDALSGMRDLLECIYRDFQADIECAERLAENGSFA